ncbi:MAG: peptidylprolyl isomerase [Gilvibacter sp.]
MKHLLRITILCLLITPSVWAQTLEEKVILTVDDRPVTAGEFMRVYGKNLELVQDPEQKDLDNYLSLYVDYKLKVAEAYDKKLDTTNSHALEFRKYKHQLATTYMSINDVTDELMKEAFGRLSEQIKARHIVINSSPDDLPQDTLVAYNKLLKIREDVLSGKEDFEIAARKYSDDPSAPSTGGDLGWFSAFKMVYPFETVAYNTPVGETSQILRSPFGFHFLQVQDRRTLPKEVTVAHIMITAKKDDPSFNPEARIGEIYGNLQQGASFEELAKQFSDDKNTAVNGGKLNRFGPGQLNAEVFEEQAFAVAQVGAYSAPFKTDYGWHIVKLLERHEYPTFESVAPRLKKQVQQAQRLDLIKSLTVEELKERYNMSYPDHLIEFFTDFFTEEITKKEWVYTDSLNPKMKTVIYDLPHATYTYHDFAEFVMDRQRRSARHATTYGAAKGYFAEYELQTLRDYFKDHLDLEDPEFAKIVNEYREGLLIFDLMDQTIWGAVKTDTVGLEKFYRDNTQNYQFKKRVNALIAQSPSEEVANQLRKKLKKGASLSSLKEEFAQEDAVKVIFTQGVFEVDARELPEGYSAKKGVSKVYNTNDQYAVISVANILPESTKPLEEVRGAVMGDYQVQLEKDFMKGLHDKFDVVINQEVLNEVKNKYN